MADVIDLKQYKEEHTPHISGKARCMDCKHKWVAVAPVGTDSLECPECRGLRGVWVGHIQASGKHWTCRCGSQHFCITPDSVYCPRCGTTQTGFQKG